MFNRLQRIGFELEKTEIHSSLSAAVDYITNHQLNPFYLLTKDARNDFPANAADKEYDSVVVGLAPEEFHYECLNNAFKYVIDFLFIFENVNMKFSFCFSTSILLLNKENKLIAINEGKYYKRKDGLAIGAGFFVKGLEYSTGTKAILIGKPNEYFFRSAIPTNIAVEECIMIGDV